MKIVNYNLNLTLNNKYQPISLRDGFWRKNGRKKTTIVVVFYNPTL